MRKNEMVVFITPIQHPATAKDFAKVEKMLSITLHSLCSQTDGDFRVVVVCNEVPNVEASDPRIVFHRVSFAPPCASDSSREEVNIYYRDKGARLMSGVLFSRRFDPDYVFPVDSDDWINQDVVRFLNSVPKHPVWYADGGYFANFHSKTVKRKHGMIRYCGSTFAYQPQFLLEVAGLTSKVDETSSKQELIAATSEFFIDEILGDHAAGYRLFSGKGVTPKAFPMRATTWVVGTGQNHSGTAGGDFGVPMTAGYCREFGLPDTLIAGEGATLKLKLREMAGAARSKVGWLRSRRSGAVCYQ